MTSRFRQTLKIVSAAHLLALLALLIVPRLRACRPPPPETRIAVALRIEPAPQPASVPRPEPEPAPTPEPKPAPKPTPAPVPKPEPKPRPPRKIEVSEKRVVRELEPKREPAFSDNVVRELEKRLTAEERNVTVDDSRLQLQRVRDALYRAWEERPGRQEADGATATVTLRFDATGRVEERVLTGPSGNAALDESVMRAVRTVTWIPGLKEEFLKARNWRVSVAFRLE